MALLRKIGSLHNHLAIETAILKDQKDCIHEAIFDDAKSLSVVDELEIKHLETKQKIDGLIEQLRSTYCLYDKHGHYKELSFKMVNRKLSIRSIPVTHNHVCRGLSGGQTPQMCVATKCKMSCHIKTRFGLKYKKPLYQ
eukprot:12614368-Ditylum_brightwellii.AAC.1